MLKANSLGVLNRVLGKNFKNDNDLIDYMSKHKTDTALKMFDSSEDLNFPEYINNAIKK